MIQKWKILSTKTVFDNKWFPIQKDIVKLPNGKIVDDYYLWKKFDVALVVPITDQTKIILVKQYKHGSKELMIECPAGYTEKDENFLDCAKRELLEETGYVSDKFELLGKFIHDPTKTIGITKSYLAKNVKKVTKQKLDENEEIEVLELSIEEVLNMIYGGKIWTTGTIAAIFLALKKIGYKI